MPSRTWHQVNYRRGGDVYGAMNDSIMLRRHVRYVSRHITHDAYWFHASDMDTDDLATSLEKNRNKRTGQGNLHVGTIEAALYRRHPTLHCTARPYIHVFRIDPDALISPWWLHDDGTPEATCREKIYRYVNAYEGCGSVSLVGNLNLFKMVDTIKLPPGNEKDRLWELPRSAQRKIRAYM